MISRGSFGLAALVVTCLIGLTACASTTGPVRLSPVRAVSSAAGAAHSVSPDAAYYASAVSAISGHDYALALDMLQLARTRGGDEARILNAMGVVYDKVGRFDLSERYYNLAAIADPGSAIVEANRRYSLLLQRQQQRAAPDGNPITSLATDSWPRQPVLAAADPAPARILVMTPATDGQLSQTIQAGGEKQPRRTNAFTSAYPPIRSFITKAVHLTRLSGGGLTRSKTVAADDPALDRQIAQALDENRYLDAASLLERAAAGGGWTARLSLLAGELQLARGDYGAALTDFHQAQASPETRPDALQGEGVAFSLLGQSEDAVTALKAAVLAKPGLWRAWNALGRECDLQQDWPGAEKAYVSALQAGGDRAVLLNNRGFSRLAQNRLHEASDDFIAALRQNPAMSAARTNLRVSLALIGDYHRALEHGPADDAAIILNNVGFAAALRGDLDRAGETLRQAVAERPVFYERATANLGVVERLRRVPTGPEQGNEYAAR